MWAASCWSRVAGRVFKVDILGGGFTPAVNLLAVSVVAARVATLARKSPALGITNEGSR
jgi:hypothetical protein